MVNPLIFTINYKYVIILCDVYYFVVKNYKNNAIHFEMSIINKLIYKTNI